MGTSLPAPKSTATLATVCFVVKSLGVPVLIPEACLAMLPQGAEITLTLVRPATVAEPNRDWIRISDAARIMVRELDGQSHHPAVAAICRAADKGDIADNGQRGAGRLIDKTAFIVWLRDRRNAVADREDDDVEEIESRTAAVRAIKQRRIGGSYDGE